MPALVLDVATVSLAFAAAAMCMVAARRARSPWIFSWYMFGLGCFSWGAGEAAWAYFAWNGDALPYPSMADVGYLGLPVLFAAGLVPLVVPAGNWHGRVRALLDGWMIAAAALIVVWTLVLHELIGQAASQGTLATAVGIVYPTIDGVLTTLVLFVMVRARQEGRPVPLQLTLLFAGILSLAVSDMSFAYGTLSATWDGTGLLDVGWTALFGFVLVAAAYAIWGRQSPARADDRSAPIAQFTPYLAIVLAGAFSFVGGTEKFDMSAGILWACLIGALMTRQVLALHENRMLTLHLEARVAERTHALERSEQRFRSLVQRSSDVVVVLDGDEVITYVTASVDRVFGYRPQTLIGQRIRQIVAEADREALGAHLGEAIAHQDDVRTVDVDVLHAAGAVRQTEMTITNMLTDPNVRGFVLNVRDVSAQRALEARLVHDAFHDTLTGLPNRSLLSERLSHALARRRGDRRVAVLFIDLDDFKRVNDTLGHAAGDHLLTEVAGRLLACVRSADTVARLGGDEFAVLLEDADGAETPTAVAERICESMTHDVVIGGREIPIRASIGIALAGDGDDEGRLLQCADLAMYRAKALETGGFVVYDPSMHADFMERIQLEEDLRRSLVGDLSVQYQPVFELAHGRMVAAEALVRWTHPERGAVPPTEFIGVAEESGLIREIGRFVLAEAIHQLAAWRSQPGAGHLTVAVNVSAAELRDGSLVDFVRTRLLAAELPPEALVLEVTESILVEHTDLETLHRLKELGVTLAIDDFGTGYSSLSYLHRCPVDILKVDRSFVERLGADGRDSGFVQTIVGLGRSLELVTLAEGIETRDQWETLVAVGCEQGQGRIFSMPVPAANIDERLYEWVVTGVAELMYTPR